MADKKRNKIPLRTQIPKAWFVVFGVTIVVAIGGLFFKAGNPDPILKPAANISGLKTGGKESNFNVTEENVDNSDMTPAYKEMIEALDDESLETAKQSGSSFVAVAKPQFSIPKDENETVTPQVEPKLEAVVVKKEQPVEEKKVVSGSPNALMLAFLDERQKNWAPYAKHASFVTPSEVEPQQPTARGDGTTSDANPNTTPVLNELSAGDLLFVSNDVALNSDFSVNEVIGTVQYGPHKGSTVLGKFTHNKEGHFVVLYDTLVKLNGVKYSFKGYAIDMKTKYLAVASDVDHHYFERWGGLIAASLLKGYASAVQLGNSTSQTITNASGTTTTTTNDDLSNSEMIAVTAGQVGNELSGIMQENFNRPTTTKLYGDILLAIKVFDVNQGAKQ